VSEPQTCLTWPEVDAALDRIEEGDAAELAKLFLLLEGSPVSPSGPDGRWGRITITSFSRRAGVARHRLDKWVQAERLLTRESA
jgi:hypothetical protein